MPSVGAVSVGLAMVTKTAAYTARAGEMVNTNATSGALTITLPAGPTAGQTVAVKKTDVSTNPVTVAPYNAVSTTINGDTSVALVVQGAGVTVQFDGTNWQITSTAMVNVGNSVAGLPTGGAAGQALIKGSATNFDAAWATPATVAGGLFSPWSSPGRYYTVPTAMPPTTNASSPGDTSTHFYPVRIPNACTLASIGIINTGGSNSSAYLGLFTDSPTAASGGPATRVAGGTFTVNSGVNTQYSPLAVGLAVAAGNYWVALCMASIANVSLVCTPTVLQNYLVGGKSATSTSTFYTANMKVSTAYTAGAATPADASTLTLQDLATAYTPLFLFTVA